MSQHTHTGEAARKATVTGLFAAYKAKDRAAAEALIHSDFRFTSPYDDAIDRTTYFERCWPNSDRIRAHVIERLVLDGDGAFVTYLAVMVDGASFRNTEYFTFKGAQVASVDVYFGASYRGGVFVAKAPP